MCRSFSLTWTFLADPPGVDFGWEDGVAGGGRISKYPFIEQDSGTKLEEDTGEDRERALYKNGRDALCEDGVV